jgi:hypothetical protein
MDLKLRGFAACPTSLVDYLDLLQIALLDWFTAIFQ